MHRSAIFAAGELPSQYAEAQGYPRLQQLLAEQVDMQFADIRALLRLPQDVVAAKVGRNFTAMSMLCNQISGFSVWFFHNRAARRIKAKEVKQRRRDPLAGARFKAFVYAYYPRQLGEPGKKAIGDESTKSGTYWLTRSV